MPPPVLGDTAGRTGNGLVSGVMPRRGEPRADKIFPGLVVPEPVLAGLEALHDRMPGGLPVRGRVLGGRGVAAAHVPALGAPAQVHPPAAGRVALDAAGAAGRRRRVDARYLSHCSFLSIRSPAATPGTGCRRDRFHGDGPVVLLRHDPPAD